MFTDKMPSSTVSALIVLVPFIANSVQAENTQILPTSFANEESLLSEPGEPGILEQLYGPNNLVRIADHNDDIWRNQDKDPCGKFGARKFVVRARYTDSAATFGYIDTDDVFNPIFSFEKGKAVGLDTSFATIVGCTGFELNNNPFQLGFRNFLDDKEDPDDGVRAVPPLFRWGLRPSADMEPIPLDEDPSIVSSSQADNKDPSIVSSSQADNNGGADQMTTWVLTQELNDKKFVPAGTIVIAWDDTLNGDRDFNDMVVEINNVSPARRTHIDPAQGALGPTVEQILQGKYGTANYHRVTDYDDRFWIKPNDNKAVVEKISGAAVFLVSIGVTGNDPFEESLGAIPLGGRKEIPSNTPRHFRWFGEREEVEAEDGPTRTTRATSHPEESALQQTTGELPTRELAASDSFVTWCIGIKEECDDRASNKYAVALENPQTSYSTNDRIVGDFKELLVEVSNVRPARNVNESFELMDDKTEVLQPGDPFRFKAVFKNTGDMPISSPFLGVARLEFVTESPTPDDVQIKVGGEPVGSVGAVIDNLQVQGDTLEVTFTVTFLRDLETGDRFRLFVDIYDEGP